MAIQIEARKVYHASSPMIGAGLIQVIGGSITIYGSNKTEYDPETKKLVVPAWNDLISTGDTIAEGFHPLTGLPEWFGIDGDATEVWVKMCVDQRIEPGEE